MMSKYWGLILLWTACSACSSSGETKKPSGEAPAPALSATAARSRTTSKETTRKEQAVLAEDQVRVPLFVLPGDATVEVDDMVVRRRNGTIELIGKAGEERRVRVFSGMTQTPEKKVRIEATGASPSTIDVRTTPTIR